MTSQKSPVNRVPKDKLFERRKLVARTGIVHALDVDDLDRARDIARSVEPYVDAIKVSWPTVMEIGCKEVIYTVRRSVSLPIMADFKVADIPEISSRIVQKAIRMGADGVILQGFVGKESMKACIDEAHRGTGYTFVVTEMSHPGAELFMQPVGVRIAELARELGSDGIIAPATRPERTREYRRVVGKDLIIVSPGVGAQGAEVGDAIKAGADFEVIGRKIYEAQDPGQAAKQLSEKMALVRKELHR